MTQLFLSTRASVLACRWFCFEISWIVITRGGNGFFLYVGSEGDFLEQVPRYCQSGVLLFLVFSLIYPIFNGCSAASGLFYRAFSKNFAHEATEERKACK